MTLLYTFFLNFGPFSSDRKYGADKLRFPHAKEFHRKLGTRPQKGSPARS
jgi:hypothetical protein